jgi:hypothetical protein
MRRTSLGRGASRDSEQLEARLVWVFGSPRSWSTSLLQLVAHPLG